MLELVIFSLIFLFFSGLFSGSEIAFISASKLGIELKKEKSIRGAILSSFYERPKRFITTMLVGNNIALVAFTFTMTLLLEPFIRKFLSNEFGILLLITLVLTIIVLIFGEFFPKVLFRVYADKILYALTYPLLVVEKLLAIPTIITNWISNFILTKILKAPVEKIETAFNRLDLADYIDEVLEENGEDIDKGLFTNALNLGDLKVSQCMVPRTEIIFVDKTESPSEAIDIFVQSKHSRLIVVEDNDIEQAIGYIHHQQMFNNTSGLDSLLYPISFVPEIMTARDLMSYFINNNINIAMVVDEYGSIAGLVTLEDIIEEIFGDIEDEHDKEEHIELKISENEFLFSGRLEILYLNENYPELEIPEGDYHTLSGYIVTTEGKIPNFKDEFIIDSLKFVIEEITENKIDLIRIFRLIDDNGDPVASENPEQP